MNPSPRIHVPSLLQFALSGVIFMLTLPVAVFTVVLVLAALMSGQDVSQNAPVLLSAAWTAFFVSLLVIPGAALALMRLFGRERPRLLRISPLRAASLALLLWPVILFIGWLSSSNGELTWLVLPPLQVLAVALPVWWFIEVGRSKLADGNAQRGWGIFSLGLVAGPLLAMVLELLAIIALVIIVIMYISLQPGLADEVMRLVERLQGLDPQSPRALDLLRPYLESPTFLALLAGVVSGIVPLIEELVKPLPVLLLALWRKIPPVEGFIAGLISGGAFGLVESLGLASNLQGESWAPVLATRVGTGLLHIVTTSLVGWGLASAIREKRWLRLLLTYISAVSLHGIWNLLGISVGVESLNLGPAFDRVALFAAAGLALLALLLYTILVRMNLRLRRDAAPTPALPAVDVRP